MTPRSRPPARLEPGRRGLCRAGSLCRTLACSGQAGAVEDTQGRADRLQRRQDTVEQAKIFVEELEKHFKPHHSPDFANVTASVKGNLGTLPITIEAELRLFYKEAVNAQGLEARDLDKYRVPTPSDSTSSRRRQPRLDRTSSSSLTPSRDPSPPAPRPPPPRLAPGRRLESRLSPPTRFPAPRPPCAAAPRPPSAMVRGRQLARPARPG
ncbi:hypothetical protein CDD83_3034 [Cordyceps sp. RAO-2017]|nr:hypothetical protein CDD83_3034 [Cordyceps sp. RAO-2017]